MTQGTEPKPDALSGGEANYFFAALLAAGFLAGAACLGFVEADADGAAEATTDAAGLAPAALIERPNSGP